MKRNLFYFGLEPLKARYTYQLCKEWMPKTFEKYDDKLLIDSNNSPMNFYTPQSTKSSIYYTPTKTKTKSKTVKT